MEFADNGDLFQKITNYQKASTLMPEDEIWHVFIQTVRGLSALHDLKILHRDMKVSYIFHIECKRILIQGWNSKAW
jgi:NIMA (never in mitosis gene a)-related kinase